MEIRNLQAADHGAFSARIEYSKPHQRFDTLELVVVNQTLNVERELIF